MRRWVDCLLRNKYMKILLASRNRDKLREVRGKVAPLGVEILTPADFPNLPEVEEDGRTLEENARKKALTLYRLAGIPTLADDTGLEVDALNGKPGVYSSRFAGERATYADNVNKLLRELAGIPWGERWAQFRCVLAYASEGQARLFEGRIEGVITLEAMGGNGFGYDPVFWVAGEGKTLAQLSLKHKNQISHRGKALDAWVKYVRSEISKSERGSA